MAIIIGDQRLRFGTHQPKPLEGFPSGRVRLRIRGNSFVKAFVKTEDGIREFTVVEENGKWMPGYETGRNLRT